MTKSKGKLGKPAVRKGRKPDLFQLKVRNDCLEHKLRTIHSSLSALVLAEHIREIALGEIKAWAEQNRNL